MRKPLKILKCEYVLRAASFYFCQGNKVRLNVVLVTSKHCPKPSKGTDHLQKETFNTSIRMKNSLSYITEFLELLKHLIRNK